MSIVTSTTIIRLQSDVNLFSDLPNATPNTQPLSSIVKIAELQITKNGN